jgi:hypothetical protein
VPLAPRVATLRRALVLGTFVTASVVSIPSSWAGTIVSNVADGVLTVTGSADADDVTVRCEGGDLIVNQRRPLGGPTRCGDLRRIAVFAGAGVDRVSLADVTSSAFDSLAATSISGQGGTTGSSAPRSGTTCSAAGASTCSWVEGVRITCSPGPVVARCWAARDATPPRPRATAIGR